MSVSHPTLSLSLFRILPKSMARQTKLNFAGSNKAHSTRLKKPVKETHVAARADKLRKILRGKTSGILSNSIGNDTKSGPSSNNPPFEWCKTYPGSVWSLSNPSLRSGDSWKIKVVTWNVNGLRAWIRKGGLSYLEDEVPDALCLQEVKCPRKDIPPVADVDEYLTHWYTANKPGYAGTGLYSKVKPLKVVYGLGEAKHDNEGRLITAEYEKFYLINAYVPNSGRGLVRLDYRINEWNKDLCEYIKKLDKEKPVVLTGDLNVSHKEIDLSNPAGNHKTAGFTDEERQGFSEMLADCDMVDTYRHFYPNREKAYTYWSTRHNARQSNAGWRLDYFVVSRRLLPNVVDQEIRCGVLGSDHCPVVLYLNFN